jgi:alkyl hydroperoxide reductase subunit F
MYDMIIIGAGPAGLVAAVYAVRKKLNTLLISGDIGGQINTTLGIENYMGYQFIEGPELVAKFRDQVGKYPVDQKIGNKVSRVAKVDDGFEVIDEKGNKFQGRTIVLAMGKRPRMINVPGESRFTGKGVSYCAVCDGPVFAGQRVVVVGGGNSGLEAALDMLKIAEHVSLVTIMGLTGDDVLVRQLKRAKNLTIYTKHKVEKIEGEGFVSGIVIKGVDGGVSKRLAVTGVFIEIGLEPNTESVKDLLKLNQWGEIPVSCATATEIAGLYAAGDVTDVPEKQIIVAAGEGAKASLQAHRYLQREAGTKG